MSITFRSSGTLVYNESNMAYCTCFISDGFFSKFWNDSEMNLPSHTNKGSFMTEFLNKIDFLGNIRRNHALEHATINVLRRKGVHGAIGGISGPNGFWLVGQVDPTTLQEASEDALRRLKAGQKHLAISKQCGTNYVVPGVLAGIAAWIVMIFPGKGDWKDKWERLPLVMAVVTLVTMLAEPLGPIVQEKVATDPNPGDMKITGIMLYHRYGKFIQHIIVKQ